MSNNASFVAVVAIICLTILFTQLIDVWKRKKDDAE